MENIIKCKGGRTGKEIHYAFSGSSALLCGSWLKASVNYFRVPNNTPVTCDKCKEWKFEDSKLKA